MIINKNRIKLNKVSNAAIRYAHEIYGEKLPKVVRNRICSGCNCFVRKETDSDYPFVCLQCDENMYEFETIKVKRTNEKGYYIAVEV